ncbi:MAG: HAD family hydrolase [Deltaproteobacteria bacterium]|nr:MAG: HAD family hydrolase [Deltaproteobacteria bacterium]
MKCKAIIFDMDGTLLDTIEDIGSSMNTVLRRMGLPVHDTLTYKTLVGDGMEILVKRALPESMRDKDTIKSCLDAMKKVYSLHCLDKTRPFNGIDHLLDALAQIDIKMAILSNKPHDFTVAIKDALLSRWPFVAVLGVKEGIPRKPDPKGALQIARLMGVRPSETCFMGDTAVDMKTANNAGMYAVGVLWGFRGIKELKDAGARLILEKPIDLMSYLKK